MRVQRRPPPALCHIHHITSTTQTHATTTPKQRSKSASWLLPLCLSVCSFFFLHIISPVAGKGAARGVLWRPPACLSILPPQSTLNPHFFPHAFLFLPPPAAAPPPCAGAAVLLPALWDIGMYRTCV